MSEQDLINLIDADEQEDVVQSSMSEIILFLLFTFLFLLGTVVYEMKTAMDGVNNELRSVKNANNKTHAKFTSIKNANEKLLAELTSVKNANERLLAELTSVKNANEKLLAESTSVKNANEKLLAELTSVKNANEKLLAELTSVKNANERLLAELTSVKNANEKLLAELTSVKNANEKLLAESTSVKNANEKLLAELTSVKNTNSELESQIAHLLGLLGQAQSDSIEDKEEIGRLNIEIKRLNGTDNNCAPPYQEGNKKIDHSIHIADMKLFGDGSIYISKRGNYKYEKKLFSTRFPNPQNNYLNIETLFENHGLFNIRYSIDEAARKLEPIAQNARDANNQKCHYLFYLTIEKSTTTSSTLGKFERRIENLVRFSNSSYLSDFGNSLR